MEFHSLKCKVLTITNNILVTSDWSWNSSPSEMIGALGWNSLELLRKQSSLVMLHKIVNRQIASAQDLLPKFSRGNSSNFQQVLGRVLAYLNSFVPVTTKWWNELPRKVTMLESQSEFFNELTKYLDSIFNFIFNFP